MKCGDGEWIYFGCGTVKQWHSLCTAVGCEELTRDARCQSLNDVIRNTPDLIQLIRPRFAQHTAEEWISILRDHDIPCERHRHLSEMASDEQLIANGFIEPFQYGEKVVMLPNPPILMDSQNLHTDKLGPAFGDSTDALLMQAGCSEEILKQMKERGAIVGA